MKQPANEDLVKSIASETGAPVREVTKMYEETWAEYCDGAHIMDFLAVLVARRVRENLRNMHKEVH